MIGLGASSARGYGAALLGLGLLLGGLVAVQPALAVVAVGGAAAVAIGAGWPPVLVAGMYAGILFDRLGVTGAKLGDFPITASKLSVLGGIGLWAVHASVTTARPFRWHPVLGALLGVLATTAVTTAWASSMAAGKFTLYGLAMMWVMVALVYAILAEARLEPLFRFLAAVLVAALVASVSRPNVAGADGRVAGTMGDPNEWATTVLLLGPLLLGGLADDEHVVGRVLRPALVALVPLGVLRSESRAALVVLVLVAPACLYLLRRRRGELLLCGAGAVVATPFLLDLETTLARFWQLLGNLRGQGGAPDQSLEERSELFRQGVQLFRDHWFIGVGPGNFETATGFVSHTGTLRPAHNTYLEIASEQGVVGLLPALLFLALVGATLWRTWQAAPLERDRTRVLGAATGLAAFALMAATLGLLTFAMGYLVLGLTLAIVHQAGRTERGGDVVPR